MERRAFLVGSACGMGAAAFAGPALALGVGQAAQVLRLDPEAGVWRPFTVAAALTANAEARRLRLLGPRLADGSRLRSVQLDLVFEAGRECPARHRAWRFDAAREQGNSGDCSLQLPAGGLVMEFRLAAAADAVPEYLRVDAVHWPEGDYLVRLDAAPMQLLACGPAERCAVPAGIDGFLLQVRAEPEAPDLCLRADLACQAQEPALA